MSDLQPSLLIHLRGTGEEGFTMPPLTAVFSSLGLQLPAERLIEETRFQKRRAAVLVGPTGCGKSHWLGRFGHQQSCKRAVLSLDACAQEWAQPETGGLVLIDRWEVASAAQRRRCQEWLEQRLRADAGLDAVLVTRSDELAMELSPATWLEFQWAPPSASELEAALSEWGAPRSQALLDCLADPCLAMLARRPAFWGCWPDSPPVGRAQVVALVNDLRDTADCPDLVQECIELQALWRGPARTIRWIDLPAGQCLVGSPESEAGRWADESPQLLISLTAFSLSETVVTNAQFLAANIHASQAPPWWGDARYARPDQPLTGFSQPQSRAFAAALGLTLPSETQWEYACRAGSRDLRYADIHNSASHAGNSGYRLPEVGTLLPNRFGLHDMLGCTWEWTLDHCHDRSELTPVDGSAWLESDGECAMLRGGSWADRERVIRAATRLKRHPGPRVANIGMRLLRSASRSEVQTKR